MFVFICDEDWNASEDPVVARAKADTLEELLGLPCYNRKIYLARSILKRVQDHSMVGCKNLPPCNGAIYEVLQ